jgi:tungstate transport system substrate-binding protein
MRLVLSRLFPMCMVMLAGAAAAVGAEPQTLVVASTTSTQDSGLFAHLLPVVRERTGVVVKVIAQGTGQALETARRGDADVVFVHDPEAEERFVSEGHGLERHPVMYNDFVIVGPAADPARIRGKGVRDALKAIADGAHPFVSRGDRSGTHQAELRLWKDAQVSVDSASHRWYRAVGQGMGSALNIASASDAYVLADRATWISFRNKRTLQLLVEGDPRMHNPYSLILVNKARHPGVNEAAGRRFVEFLLSPEGQGIIATYRIEGQQLFFPDASTAAK